MIRSENLRKKFSQTVRIYGEKIFFEVEVKMIIFFQKIRFDIAVPDVYSIKMHRLNSKNTYDYSVIFKTKSYFRVF